MKTVKKQGLTALQKQYLRRRVVWYFLYVASNKRVKVKKSAPKKVQTHHDKPEIIPPSKLISKSSEPEPLQTEEKLKKRRINFRFSFPRSRALRFAAVTLTLLVGVVLLQLAYPPDRALPTSRLESAGYLGFADRDEILSSFENFDSRVVTVHTHTKSITTSYRDLGVTVRPYETVEQLTDYSLQERLVPFSILVKGNRNHAISRELDESQLALFVDNVIAQASKSPVDAVVSLKGTQLLVKEAEDGYEYQASTLRSRVLRSDLADRGQIVFTPTILKPSITTEDAEVVVARMQLRIDNPLLINAENKSLRIEPAAIASWIDISHQPKEKTVEVVFNKKRVDETLRPLIAQVDYEPVSTVVTYLNGSPAGRVEGSVGKKLQYDALVERVTSNTSPLTSTIEASVITVPSPEVIDRRYSKDSQGLQTLLNYWTSVNQGSYSVDFRTVSGNIKANVNPHRLLPSIGIYRNYIASLIYGRVTAGSLGLNSITQTGQSVDVCLDLMVRDSDEGCTNALGTIVGWGASDSLLKAQGFDGTTLTMGAGLTTADDMSEWMVKLLGGQITLGWQADQLVDKMTRSVYRGGIPAGSPGILVANKFGSFGRFTHDTGIVYHPNGTYVLSVLGEGASDALIATLTSEINKIMSQ